MNGYRHIAHGAFIVGNGRWDFLGDTAKRSNAFEVSNDGHAIVYGNRKTFSDPALVGARYKENTTVAWGYVDFGGGINGLSGFGVRSANWVPGNLDYKVILDYRDPYSNAQVQIVGAAIRATLVYLPNQSYPHCATITTSPMQWDAVNLQNFFTVQIFHATASDCIADQHPFMFNVLARQ